MWEREDFGLQAVSCRSMYVCVGWRWGHGREELSAWERDSVGSQGCPVLLLSGYLTFLKTCSHTASRAVSSCGQKSTEKEGSLQQGSLLKVSECCRRPRLEPRMFQSFHFPAQGKEGSWVQGQNAVSLSLSPIVKHRHTSSDLYPGPLGPRFYFSSPFFSVFLFSFVHHLS